jgi:hypothetical protein
MALKYLKFLALFSLGLQLCAICLPHAFCTFLLYKVFSYFRPEYETAIIKGYKRPVIGLVLCRKCWVLRYWPASSPVPHHNDLASLEASASGTCWLCKTVYKQLLSVLRDLEDPPVLNLPDVTRRESHRLVFWFAERTRTRSGFLDDFRGKSITPSIDGSTKAKGSFRLF